MQNKVQPTLMRSARSASKVHVGSRNFAWPQYERRHEAIITVRLGERKLEALFFRASSLENFWRAATSYESQSMKKTAFICGPELGHVGRLYKIAARLRATSSAEITFVTPQDGKYANLLCGNEFEIRVIPIPEDSHKPKNMVFAEGLAQLFATEQFDLVVQDIGPLEWLSATRFPDCPRVVVTNIFLTRLATSETGQMKRMKEEKAEIDRSRNEMGLPPLDNVFDLYEADRVLLADPLPIVQEFGELPLNYVACGAAPWSLEGQLPIELSDKTDLLLMSMGSTGRKAFKPNRIEKVRERLACSYSVYVGDKHDAMRARGVADFQFEWLPLEPALSKTKVVLSQGGAGSSYQALSKGVPVIALPNHRNQQVLGEILEKLGVGVCIGRGENLVKRLPLIDLETISANAKRFGVEIAREDGAAKAAHQIEGFL